MEGTEQVAGAGSWVLLCDQEGHGLYNHLEQVQ